MANSMTPEERQTFRYAVPVELEADLYNAVAGIVASATQAAYERGRAEENEACALLFESMWTKDMASKTSVQRIRARLASGAEVKND